MKFKVNDEAIITGDQGDLDHDFPPGTKVTIIGKSSNNPEWWHCGDEVETWWVHEMDLEPVDQGPTEEEVAALFGLHQPVEVNPQHPHQPLVRGTGGTIRFKGNKIIEHLFRTGALDLNALAVMNFPDEDRIQLAQLLGYSVDGFGTLPYVPVTLAEEMDAEAARLEQEQS